MFSLRSKLTLAKATAFQNAPVYVQFYITSRCNLKCTQCNIIYTNSDVRECSLDEIKRIADNFASMGVAMVLLTGGEPFVRQDLPDIIRAFESRGIHVRMQTNGLATEERIVEVIEAGGRDISISLDSLKSINQDEINGGFPSSWQRALRSISYFTRHLPKEGSFASLGCVMQPQNLEDTINVIKFGTAISWFTSLCPVHVTSHSKPRGFRSFDQSLKFLPKDYERIDNLIEEIRAMKGMGYLLYDSDQYLDDIKRFVKKEPITWRKKNKNVCDSPNLYFALLPNGEFSPCCDFRIDSSVPAYDKNFEKIYRSALFKKEVHKKTSSCSGCMYGSYPEMTISMRYLKPKLERIKTFVTAPPKKKWPFEYNELIEIAEQISNGDYLEDKILN